MLIREFFQSRFDHEFLSPVCAESDNAGKKLLSEGVPLHKGLPGSSSVLLGPNSVFLLPSGRFEGIIDFP